MAHQQFEEIDAQVLGISTDSVFAHKAFASTLGGLSYPLLADWHPKGRVMEQYGLMQPSGYNSRACFIIDKSGVVRFKEIYKGAIPDVQKLLNALRNI